MNYKLKAYTLLDVIISMVIMSVISLIIFVLFSSFLKQLAVFHETNSKLTDYALFKNNIKREFYLSKRISNYSNTIQIEMNDSLNIVYNFKDDFILRTAINSTDTIQLIPNNFSVKTNQRNLVSELNLEILLFGETIPLTLRTETNFKQQKIEYED